MAQTIACSCTLVNLKSVHLPYIALIQQPADRTAMQSVTLNMDALNADMAAHVERTSARKFSLSVTGGRNPDWYRNYLGRQNTKPPTIEQFFNIASELGKDPLDYICGGNFPSTPWPNEAVLTQTMAVLLSSVGVDPYEDERARKIARLLPDALQDVQRLIENLGQEDDATDAAPAHNLGATAPQL